MNCDLLDVGLNEIFRRIRRADGASVGRACHAYSRYAKLAISINVLRFLRPRQESDEGKVTVSETVDGVLTMTIRKVNSDDTDSYICRSNNSVGQHETSATLTVQCESIVVWSSENAY